MKQLETVLPSNSLTGPWDSWEPPGVGPPWEDFCPTLQTETQSIREPVSWPQEPGTSCQEAVCQTRLQQMGPGWCPGRTAGVRGHIPEATERIFALGGFGCWRHTSCLGSSSGSKWLLHSPAHCPEAQQDYGWWGKTKLKSHPQTPRKPRAFLPRPPPTRLPFWRK